jgi:hypothetical protein
MDPMTFEVFEANSRAQGFDEVLERRWAAKTVLDAHSHPLAVWARVVQGEMWLTGGRDVKHLGPGDEFTLERDIPHEERYGAEGATYWVARRS